MFLCKFEGNINANVEPGYLEGTKHVNFMCYGIAMVRNSCLEHPLQLTEIVPGETRTLRIYIPIFNAIIPELFYYFNIIFIIDGILHHQSSHAQTWQV